MSTPNTPPAAGGARLITMGEIESQLRNAMRDGRLVVVESTVDGRTLGGEAIITEVFTQNGELWVTNDEGMAWIVRAEGFRIAPVTRTSR